MSRRGRTELVYESDDSSGYYEVPVPPPQRHRSRSRIGIQVIDDKYGARPRMKAHNHLYSTNDVATSYEREPGLLGVPHQARPRASSTGAAPAPNFIPVYLPTPERDVSQTRIKYHKEKRRDSSSSGYDSDRKHGRRRRKSRHEEHISSETAEKLARLRILEEQRILAAAAGNHQDTAYVDPAIAERLARLRLLEEQQQRQAEQERERKYREQMDPATAEKLARLKLYEEEQKKRSRDDDESVYMAKFREKQRQDKEREDRLRAEYEDHVRKEKAAQKAAYEQAELAKAKADREAKEETDRVIAGERDRIEKAAAKEKAEKIRIMAEVKAQAAEAKAEREKMWAEERDRLDKEKKAAEEKRKQIIFEEEERKKKEKAEWEETRAKVLAEEKKKDEEAKAKKKAEEEAFNQKVKEKFMAKGYNPNYIEDVLEETSSHGRKASTSRASANSLALDIQRPTYIRVQIRHLLPETLDHYLLPWEYDPHDDKYILIKKYIDHDFQQELFRHTKKIYKQRETRLITDGYIKETTTTLKPNGKEDMYLVRRKSTGKSPSRPGRNWMFT